MLREVFYGSENKELLAAFKLTDARPREAFIAACLLLPIIAIGVYPKLATQTYDVKTVAVASQIHNVLPLVAQQPVRLFPLSFVAPPVLGIETNDLASIGQ
jgi:NAD(P)H-quinone oxidoreductase subunit 4